MTAIDILKGDTLTITIKGHAEYAEKGSDIVCSAVSILAYTLAEHLAVMYEGGLLEEKPIVQMSDGNMKLECKPKKEALHYMTTTYAFVGLGFAIIANTYPECVKLNESSLR
jgi:uncharacterized protein YsxB (DUF464 family)